MSSTNSILSDIKSLCGIHEDISDFDVSIMLHCNSVINTLAQLGMTQAEDFYITGNTEYWDDLIGEGLNLHNIKTYLYLKVKLLFDPPANATLLKSMATQAQEYEWRISMELELGMEGV